MSRLVTVLLKHADFNVNARDELGFTPLALACRQGSEDLVNCLLDSGADVDIFNKSDDRPLHIALKARNEPVALLLVGRGADILDCKGKGGKTPLHLAAEHANLDFMRMVLDCMAYTEARDHLDREPLSLCTDARAAQMLLDAGADMHHEDEEG